MKNPFLKKSSQSRSVFWFQPGSDGSCFPGYTRLNQCPEVKGAIRKIGDLISGMTIYLMQNTSAGDARVKDGLAQFMDISPYKHGTRQTLISWIVTTLLNEGDGNAFVLPQTKGGLLDNLMPMPGAVCQSNDQGATYYISWRGKTFDPDEVLHFKIWPDHDAPYRGTGIRVTLRDVLNSLGQANETKRNFLKKDYKPPLIISMDTDSDLSDPKKRSELLKEYIDPEKPDQPWILPAGLIKVESHKPLSLADLAIKDGIELDKKTVAAFIQVPAYMVGVGNFNKDEYNFDFIPGIIRTIYTCIQQELTRKLIISPDRYFKFSTRHLYAYSLTDLATIGDNQYVRGLMTGNEVRDWLDLPPKKELDQLVMLENYIPAGMIGDQKKLNQKEDTGDGKQPQT